MFAPISFTTLLVLPLLATATATVESTLSIIKLGPLPSFAPFPVVSPIKLSPMPSFTPFPVGSPSFLPRGGADACTATGNVQCCESTQSPSDLSSHVTSLLGSLGVDISDLIGNVGVTCSTIAIVGPISVTQCDNQVVCCNDNSFNGVVALGCNPINVGL
ncbi:fungal hydrophobin-domain-containing protein [Armillaria borealis]|uniref:Hydrophobin n=1 Tax=Armillaria borealis TaxID=47425 RepID=A0AA39MHX1_9AGAR|nr:fungal hydrophobin-domain-containing protein [Armillaria borealis]